MDAEVSPVDSCSCTAYTTLPASPQAAPPTATSKQRLADPLPRVWCFYHGRVNPGDHVMHNLSQATEGVALREPQHCNRNRGGTQSSSTLSGTLSGTHARCLPHQSMPTRKAAAAPAPRNSSHDCPRRAPAALCLKRRHRLANGVCLPEAQACDARRRRPRVCVAYRVTVTHGAAANWLSATNVMSSAGRSCRLSAACGAYLASERASSR